MKLIKDGKMQGWFEGFLILFGFLISYYSFSSENLSKTMTIIGLWGGLIIAAIGGYSAKAQTWQIKSFGNLTFPKDLPNIKQSQLTAKIEKFIDKTSSMVCISMLLLLFVWTPSLKPYIEIYITIVTGFVGFVAILIVAILMNAFLKQTSEDTNAPPCEK